MLQVSSVQVSYNSRKALNDVSLQVNNEKIVLVGPNGSGKSTLFKAILGIAPIQKGTILVFGKDIRSVNGELGLATNIADVYRLANLKVSEMIELYSELKGKGNDEPMSLVEQFELNETLNKRIFELSTGQQKMVANVLAVSFSPRLILLDEPFDNVDQSRRRRFIDLLLRKESEVIMSTHEFGLLRHFSDWKLCFMLEGKLWGKFDVRELDRLYVSKGKIDDALSVMETSMGTFSITLDRGDVQVNTATNLSSLLEVVAE